MILFIYRDINNWRTVKFISVKSRDSGSFCKSGQVKHSQQVSQVDDVVFVSIHRKQRRVQRPISSLCIKNFSNSSRPACYYAAITYLCLVMVIKNSVRSIDRYIPTLFSVLNRQVKTSLHGNYIDKSRCRPVLGILNRITEQFDKSGLAISQCIFYGKSSHCSDSPLRTALWCQFWHDRGAAAPVLSAFLCRWRVSPTFFGTYVDAPL